MRLFCGHAESVWMQRARLVAGWSRWLFAGLAAGALVDLGVRILVG